MSEQVEVGYCRVRVCMCICKYWLLLLADIVGVLEAKKEDCRSREGWSRWMKVTVSFGFWKRSSAVKNVEHWRKAFTFGWIDFWRTVFRPWEI